MIVDLPELKRHLRVDGDEEDSLITTYGSAASKRVQQWLGRPVYARSEDMPPIGEPGYDTYQMVADDAIRVAVLQYVDRMWNDRSGEGGASDDATPPRSIRELLSGHRVFSRIIDIVVVSE